MSRVKIREETVMPGGGAGRAADAGTSAMPQTGQAPGTAARVPGCMGQTKAPVDSGGRAASTRAPTHAPRAASSTSARAATATPAGLLTGGAFTRARRSGDLHDGGDAGDAVAHRKQHVIP